MKFKRYSWELSLALIGGILLLGPNFFNYITNKEVMRIAYKSEVCNNMITLKPELVGKVKITFDEEDAKSAFFYTVRIENDGNKPISNLPISIVMNEKIEISDAPEIITVPPVEFGEVKHDTQNLDKNRLRYVISLFNPKDVIIFKFWGFSKETLSVDTPKVYSKLPNLKVHSVLEAPKRNDLVRKLTIILSILSFLISIIIFVRKLLKQKLLKELGEKSNGETSAKKEEFLKEKRKEEVTQELIFPRKSGHNEELVVA